jgi:hypothetical protein
MRGVDVKEERRARIGHTGTSVDAAVNGGEEDLEFPVLSWGGNNVLRLPYEGN